MARVVESRYLPLATSAELDAARAAQLPGKGGRVGGREGESMFLSRR